MMEETIYCEAVAVVVNKQINCTFHFPLTIEPLLQKENSHSTDIDI